MERKEENPPAVITFSRRWFHLSAVQMGLILILGLGLYLHTFNGPFIFDDYVCIKDNPAVANFSYFTDFSKVRALNIPNDIKNNFALRPVAYLTFAMNNKLDGFEVRGYHIVNTLIHLANALLIYLLVRLTVGEKTNAPATTTSTDLTHYLPLLAALLFVAHPLQTQAVTYIAQRFTSLAAFFYLFALLLYIRARTALLPRQQRFYYVAALIVTVVAMKTKEIAFTLPVIMALYDLFFLSGDVRRRLLGLLPFFLTMAIIPLTLVWLTSFQVPDSVSAVAQSMDLVNFTKVSRWDYMITQFGVMVIYLRMLLLPFGQNLDHDYRLTQNFFELRVLGSFLILLTLAAAAVYTYLRSRKAAPSQSLGLKLFAFGIAWFFVTLSVESSIIPIDDLLVEHRVYLPSFGALLAILAAVGGIAGTSVPRQRLLLYATFLAIAGLAVMTFSRNELYRDSTAMYRDVVNKSPKKPRAHINLGLSHLDNREYVEAIKEFNLVLAAKPDQVEALIQLGYCLLATDQINEASKLFNAALKLSPDNHYAHFNLGDAYQRTGRQSEAEQEFQAALQSAPHFGAARSALARLYEDTGRKNEAIQEYRKLLRYYPNDHMAAKRLSELTK